MPTFLISLKPEIYLFEGAAKLRQYSQIRALIGLLIVMVGELKHFQKKHCARTASWTDMRLALCCMVVRYAISFLSRTCIAVAIKMCVRRHACVQFLFSSKIKFNLYRLTTRRSALACKLESLFGHLRLARPPRYDYLFEFK